MRISEGGVFRKRTARDATEKGVSIETVKDKGELLIEGVEDGLAKFKGNFIREFGQKKKVEIDGFIKNIREFKKLNGDKYKELLDKILQFSGPFGNEYYNSNLEKETDKKFTSQIDKILLFNELIEIESLGLPEKLREIADNSFKDGKFLPKYFLEDLLKNKPSEKDYKYIERALKIGEWTDIHIELDRTHVGYGRYEIFTNDEKFRQIQNSAGELKKNYGRWLIIHPADNRELNILLNKEKIEKILAMKEEMKNLLDYYQVDEIKELGELKKLADIKEEFGLERFLKGEPKTKLDKIRELYGPEEFKSVEQLINWFNISKENLELISSNKFVKKVESVSNKIGWGKKDIIHFLFRDNFYKLKTSVFEELAKDNIVFSKDVKEAKLPLYQLFEDPKGFITHYGAERIGDVTNLAESITFMKRHKRLPNIGWEYVVALRGLNKKDIQHEIPEDFLEGKIPDEPGLETAKKRFDYVKNNLPSILKPRFGKIIETIKEWEKEGKKTEEKAKGYLAAGAYVRFDAGLNAEKSVAKKLDISAEKYKELYIDLDKGFKAPSDITSRLGKGIEQLYFLMKKKSQDLEYLKSHQSNLSEVEKEIIEDKYKYLLGPMELMESIENTQKGVRLENLPLHGGDRGKDPRDWTPQSHALRDRVFYKFKGGGKENHINAKEYRLGDLKLRLYSFSEKPDPKNLGEAGMAVEIERNGKTKFLNEMETKILMKELKKRTLATLYLEDSIVLQVENGK